MTRLDVHCCCNPALVLGSLPVPDHLVFDGAQVSWAEKDDARIHLKLTVAEVSEALCLGDPPSMWFNHRLAIKSDDVSLERFRRVAGFIEN